MARKVYEGEEDYGPPEYGVRSSDIGSFLPEGTYRPLPIVWFAAAWLLQIFALPVMFFSLLTTHPAINIIACGLLTYAIGRWTFRRGMAGAGNGWRIFTVLALGFNWVVVSVAALALYWDAAGAG
ncbi:hypothetical protein SZ64_10840 [Erythrobacter sp. SG61-1L]|uniref:hypothetical protein n=1 Tax=Erythrobacter sp. SG61-1L TaxID=1603897 RepID=UPI0006C929E5|nr:hypothetical protein [Erythrobacter sp. SG61-1L]KPL68557.1 hypothetical protein SZ64_10840 [Erythrobacter sp. SG61-1L]